ncbi:MAG: cytochrome b/b6 domain-containing protein [Gammaproteobacteria bacterium]|nr:cytochrome b/b6 domain-containing protein [Gammaproteobacteria bacterium]
MSSTKASQYTTARVLHWIAGVFIGFNLMSGWRISNFDLDVKQVLIMIHSGVGLVVFTLMIVRWWWRRKNNLYTPPNWWKRPPILLQWIFYPLLLIQPVLGFCVAMYNDYEVKAFGFINISGLAESNPALRSMFLDFHTWLAVVLILMVLTHGADRLRGLFS